MVPTHFSRNCSTDSISCSKRKNRKKTRLKQDGKSRKEDQNVVVIANPPGSSSLQCRTAIAPLSQRYRYAVALLSLRCHTDIAPLSFRCRSPAVALSSRCCRTAITPVSLHFRSAAVAPAVDTQSHRYRTAIVPLSLRYCRSCSFYEVAPISHRYHSTVEPLSLRTREGINNSILNCCCYTLTPLSLLLSIGRFTRLLPQEA